MRQDSGGSVRFAGKGALNFDTLLIIRLVASSVLFAVSLIFNKLPGFVCVIFLLFSAVIAGYDIALGAYSDFQEKKYLSTQLIVTVITVLSFLIGFRAEGTALVLLYQLGLLLISYAEEKSRVSSLEFLNNQSEETVKAVSEIVLGDDAGSTELEGSLLSASSFVLKIAMLIGIAYALLLPIFTNYGFSVSIHRGMTVILVATPMSVVISMPITGITGMCYAAKHGIIFGSAEVMESVASSKTAVVDCTGTVSSAVPELNKIESDFVDERTLLAFATHALYYSEQPLAKALAASYRDDFRPELITAFEDIPGSGVEADVGGVHVSIAVRQYYIDKGIDIPGFDEVNGETYYMLISDRLAGRFVIDIGITSDSENLAEGLRDNGIGRCVLLCEEGGSESRRIADERDFSEVYSDCDRQKKLGIVDDIKNSSRKGVLYISADDPEEHSSADADIRIGQQPGCCDVLVAPDCISNLPFAVYVCKRVREIYIENALFAFAVKGILIFLSLIGYCNLWFAIFMDMVAAVATVLNSIRVTKPSLISQLRGRP